MSKYANYPEIISRELMKLYEFSDAPEEPAQRDLIAVLRNMYRTGTSAEEIEELYTSMFPSGTQGHIFICSSSISDVEMFHLVLNSLNK